MKGTHDIRFGFDFVHHLMNHWQPELGEGPRGAFHFDPGVTALNPEEPRGDRGIRGRHAVVRERLERDWRRSCSARPTASGKSSQFIKMNSLETNARSTGAIAGASTPKLTLDLGLRWELYPNRQRSAGLGIESYDPTTNEALIGGRGGIPQDNNVGLQQEALRAPSRFALPDERIDGDPKRLRHHLPFASLGRSGAAWLVSADA